MGPATASSVPLTQGALDGTLERFAREFIQDRRRDRRWRVFFRLMWLGLLVLFLVLSFNSRQQAAAPNGRHTAVVELRGEIALATDASAEALVGALRKAFEDKGSQAVVLRINSPGGSPVQSGIVHDEIKRLKAKHNKKVYAVVEEMCASGAYYIAAAADEIYADKASVVGSIGVLMNGFGFTGLMDKLGVERRLMTAGENKGMGDPFSPFDDKQKAFTQNMLDKIHAQFIKVVKEGRGARLHETPEMFSGLFWTGEQAQELGLVDGLLNLDQVARDVVKAEELIDYTPKDNVAERLAKRFGASVGQGAVQALQSMGGLR
jgi:protease-4